MILILRADQLLSSLAKHLNVASSRLIGSVMESGHVQPLFSAS